MGSASLLLSVLVIAAVAATSTAQTPPMFRCSSNATCNALIDYVVPNTTTLTSITNLFQIRNLSTLLGANNLPSSTSPNSSIMSSWKIKIPFPCLCANGTGVSNGVPVYTVQPGDYLDHIAIDVFSRLVTNQQIQAVNGIINPGSIQVGQSLRIPLPCSCDEVEGARVVHYGHVVDPGSSVEAIARTYNVSESILLTLNGIANASDLQASQVLDVPLRACSSSIRRDSEDYPLLVSNATYVYTANNCVMCNCNAANNWTLHCEPSQATTSSTSSCPAAIQCDATSSLNLGNSTASGCNRTTCSYAGFSNRVIHTDLSTQSTCPASRNGVSKIGTQGLGWNFVFTGILLLGILLK